MHKFFIDEKNIKNDSIFIYGEDVNHIVKVLRLKNSDDVLLSDGKGNEYICGIDSIDKKSVKCIIKDKFKSIAEPDIKITLYQGLPKAQKMDLIVQKSVEIGVFKIQPVIMERTVVKVDEKDINLKLRRWNKISSEAAKQSNRGIIPEVAKPISFKEALKELCTMDLSVVPYENEKGNGLKKILSKKAGIKNVGIFIGPEGGFADEEIKACIEKDLNLVTLGPRILRTETAGFVTSSIILYEISDMGTLNSCKKS